MPFEVGQIVSDYEILDVLGKGGMGRVYRVRNVISNRIEAMKLLLADLAAERELGERFSTEIRTLARLDHPNIAKLHTAFKHENQLVMMMEFIEGYTLSERARQGPIPINDAISYIAQTLAALGYAHENGVIHRDIKPSNVMLTSHGVVKLMDFGIAKSNTEAGHTRVGTTMGSMQYMSPEQVRGTGVDARSDLYSMGIVLYEITCGRRPFDSESTYGILEAHLNVTPQAPLEVNPNLPKALNDIIMTALEKEPMRRFQSADAFRRALESMKGPATVVMPRAAAAPVAAAQAAGPTMPTRSAVNNRTLWMALGALACVLVLIAAVILVPQFSKGKAAGERTRRVRAQERRQVALNTPPPQQVAQSVALPVQQPLTDTAPANQMANGVNRRVKKEMRREQEGKFAGPGRTVTAPVQAPPVQQAVTSPSQAAGPSQKDIDEVQESLMQMHSRADAVKASVNSLRRAQAADGLEISPEISGTSNRLENYLQAADRAAQNNDLAAARKYMEHAERQLHVLEAKFGR